MSPTPNRVASLPWVWHTSCKKGFVKREVTSLLGVIQWQRRVGRCPKGGDIGQVAPLDEALGVAAPSAEQL
jgi:hypothetical protein